MNEANTIPSAEELAQALEQKHAATAAVREARQQADRIIKSELGKLRPAIAARAETETGWTAADAACTAAERRYWVMREVRAKSGLDAVFPVGTRVIEVGAKRERFSGETTSRVAVVEVICDDSVHSGVLSSYGRADINETVLRILNSDGSPSRKYERLRVAAGGKRELPFGWEFEAAASRQAA